MSEDSDRIITLLEELVKWKRFEGSQLAKKILKDSFSKDSEKLAYQNSDGKSSAEVASIAAVSDFTVRSYWKKWSTEGLVVPSQKFRGRYERIFSLEDFGIDIPTVKRSVPESTVGQSSEKLGEGNE